MRLQKIFGTRIDFYKLLEEQSAYMVDSADALQNYMETLDQSYADKVKALEKDADKKRRELVQALMTGKIFICCQNLWTMFWTTIKRL